MVNKLEQMQFLIIPENKRPIMGLKKKRTHKIIAFI